MDQKKVATSLFSLNEYCLLGIFKYLKLTDLVTLKSFEQFKHISARVCAQKFKKIELQIKEKGGMDKEAFVNTLTAIGEHIFSVSVDDVNQLILQLIKDNCKNLISIELWYSNESIELQGFENLKELKLNAVTISTTELKNVFAKNAELESLEYDCAYGKDFLELVGMLPKLHSLHLHNVPHSFHLSQHLHCLDGLTKFSFFSLEDCNQLLMKLTKSSKLRELHIWMPLDTDTFDIIKSFSSLEVFSMHQFDLKENLPENIVFPPTLKSVKVTGVRMSAKTLFAAVKQLKSLDELYLGYQHDLDKSLNFNDRAVITQIEFKLREELAHRQQPLKIVYCDGYSAYKEGYIHRTPKLEITNSYASHNRSESQRITVAPLV